MKSNLHTILLTALLMLFGKSLFAYDFKVDGIYYNYLSRQDKTVSVTYKGNYSYEYSNVYSGNVVIPESVTYQGTTYSVTNIGYEAFRGCTGLTSVKIPSSVTSIGDYAFRGCTGKLLIHCNIGNATSSTLGWFYGAKFKEVVIGEEVTSIGYFAFYGCTNLTSINIPNSVTSISSYAFQGCI